MATKPPHTPISSSTTAAGSPSWQINQLFCSIHEGPEDDSGQKRQKFVHLSTDQLTLLMTCFQQQQEALQSFLPKSTPELSPKTPSVPGDALINLLDHYNKAKYEDIICRPLKPPYDGMPDQLVPFLNRLGLRHQDESWSSITYIKQGEITHDLIRHFAKINEDTVTDLARHRWSATTVNTDKLTFGHETYNARCLGRLILSSQTDELALLIIARLDPSLRSDEQKTIPQHTKTFLPTSLLHYPQAKCSISNMQYKNGMLRI